MKIEIENLKAQMMGRELNLYQKADALIEFNKLIDYVDELEQLTIPDVSNSLVADIRNKLNPINNLCAILRDVPRNLTDDEDINNIIFSEVKECEKSINYLSNL